MGAKACSRSAHWLAPEIVVSAAVGVVGLEATYEAVKLGKTVALSNKEVLVAAGELVMAAAKKAGRELLPVDSEHNAVHQCLRGGKSCGGPPVGAYRFRWPVSQNAACRLRFHHARAGPGAPQLAHGQPHHH